MGSKLATWAATLQYDDSRTITACNELHSRAFHRVTISDFDNSSRPRDVRSEWLGGCSWWSCGAIPQATPTWTVEISKTSQAPKTLLEDGKHCAHYHYHNRFPANL